MTKRLVLLVEGDGEVEAAPALVKRLLTEQEAFNAVFLDPKPLRVGGYGRVKKNDFGEWKRLLAVAAKRREIGGCLLILDGDYKSKKSGDVFCAYESAATLAEHAKAVGGGNRFSVATVFANQEFESWLIAGVESLAGRLLPGERAGVKPDVVPPEGVLDETPRDAKGWLRKQMVSGYSPVRDQADLSAMVDLELIRSRPMRSFCRLDSAVAEIVNAVRTGQHVVSPTIQKSPTG